MSNINPKHLIQYLDLTRLERPDSIESIASLAKQAVSEQYKVAAICIYPEYIDYVKNHLNITIPVATVINFPEAKDAPEEVFQETIKAVALGADEIDVVLPYQKFLKGDTAYCLAVLSACRQACEEQCMKVILETGALETKDKIRKASELAVQAGTNFLKTSTGKIQVGANIEVAQAMLEVIHHDNPQVGLKVSGGVKTFEQACSYYELAQAVMGEDWISQKTFRIGASSLLAELLEKSGISW